MSRSCEPKAWQAATKQSTLRRTDCRGRCGGLAMTCKIAEQIKKFSPYPKEMPGKGHSPFSVIFPPLLEERGRGEVIRQNKKKIKVRHKSTCAKDLNSI